jgi:hypothetical protein
MANWYVDLLNGSDSNTGSSSGSPAATWAHLTSVVAGDAINVAKSPNPTDSGVLLTATYKSITGTLSAAVTLLVDSADTTWTGETHSVASASTTCKEGTHSASLAINSSFTTGLAGYKLTANANYSAYQQISLWIQPSVNVAASSIQFNLCSDTAGVTSVNAFTVTRQLIGGVWNAITLNYGSALGSSIQSINMKVLITTGACTFLIDDINACAAPSSASCLTLNSVVGFATAIGSPWMGLKSINGTTIVFDADPSSLQGAGRGYGFATQTAEMYIRQTIQTPVVTTQAAVTPALNMTVTGTSASPITINGGCDPTSSWAQNGETHYDGVCGYGYGINVLNYINVSNIGCYRFDQGAQNSSTSGGTYTNLNLSNNTNNGVARADGNTWTNVFALSNKTSGLVMGGAQSACVLTSFTANGNLSIGINTNNGAPTNNSLLATSCVTNNNGAGGISTGNYTVFTNSTANDNTGAGIAAGGLTTIIGATTKNNTNNGISLGGVVKAYNITCSGNTFFSISNINTAYGVMYVENLQSTDSTLYYIQSVGTTIFSTFEGGVSTVNKVIQEYGSWVSQSGTVNSGTTAMQASVTSVAATQNLPVFIELGPFACYAGKTITIPFYWQRSNTGLSAQLRIIGGRYPGVGSVGTDVVTAMAPTINTWTQYTIAATPTIDCAIMVLVECWGGTTYSGYLDGPCNPTST